MSILQGVALGVALAVLCAWGYVALFTVSVAVDGRHYRFSSSTTVGDLFEQGVLDRARGDLVAIKDHRLLVRGAGSRPFLTQGDRVLAYGDLLKGTDVLRSHDGTDVVEATRISTNTIEPPTRYEGSGPIESTLGEGKPGVREVTSGVMSGQVLRRRELVAPTPRVVLRRALRRSDKTVALTFDDGPWPGTTKQIVSVLQKNHVTATFFMIGRQVRRSPGIARIVTKAGMAVGNHSDTHSYGFGRMSASVVLKELSYAQHDIAKATGQRPSVFRPPGGIKNKHMYSALKKLNLKWALWTVDTGDWRRPSPGKITSIAVKNVKPGAVILMHDGGGDRSSTVKALPGIIKRLKSMGYSFVTLDALGSLPHTMG